jgi:hypothetical protein
MIKCLRECVRLRRQPPTTLARPRHWSVQFLGLKITRAYARHLFSSVVIATLLTLPSLIPGSGTIFRYGCDFR